MPSWGWWLIVGAYVVGWLLSIPGALQRRMLGWECPGCRGVRCYNRSHGDDVRRGSYRERTGKDAAIAVARATYWLPRLIAVLVVGVLRSSGRGMVGLINRATPLTGPELARRMAEQEQEIARLTAQINEGKNNA